MYTIEISRGDLTATNTGCVSGLNMSLKINGKEITSYFVERWDSLFDDYEREFTDVDLWEPQDGRPFLFLTRMLENTFPPGIFDESFLPIIVSCGE